MKKCPKCDKTYDDTWGICLHCNKPLITTKEDEKPKPPKEAPEEEIYDDFSLDTTESTDDKVEDLENRIDDLESKVNDIEDRMITWGRLIFGLLIFFLFYKYGDKIWKFIVGIFALIVSLIFKK